MDNNEPDKISKLNLRKLNYQIIAAFMAFWIFLFLTLKWIIFHPFKPFWQVDSSIQKPEILEDTRWGSHKYIQIKGIKLHYVEKGNKNNPLIILLHGFPECWFSWHKQIEELSKEFWVIAPDIRGFGWSSKPEDISDYYMQYIVEDIKCLVLSTGKPRFHLVGHDWGGAIAWHFVAIYPELIESYVLMNTSSPKAMATIFKIDPLQKYRSWYMIFFQLPYFPELFIQSNNFKTFRKFVYTEKNNTKNINHYFNVMKYLFRKRDSVSSSINIYRANFVKNRSIQNLLKTEKLKEVRVMVLWGINDKFFSPKVPDLIAEESPNTKIVKIEGSHFIHQDHPERVNQELLKFFKE